MADVFVSYKKEDHALADRFVEALRADGFSVWWDDGLTPKTAWDAALEREIAAAAAVVVLWTPRSIGSEWVRTEAHYAQDRGKLVPVMAEPCTIPISFMLRQTVRLAEWNGDRSNREWRKLLTWIADLASTKLGNANIPQALGAAQPNPFREAIAHLPSGDPVVDGAFVTLSTPAATAFRDGEGWPIMRILQGGAFTIGSPPGDPDRSAVEGPCKRVEIPAPFAIGIYPVLVREFEAVMGRVPGQPGPLQPVRSSWATRLFGFGARPPAATASPAGMDPADPVTQVSYNDAQAFVERLSSLSGEGYRLPSESEWEYACRSGSSRRYAFGDRIEPGQALFALTTGPVPPGAYAPNAFGLYDMHGNVREWAADMWHESYDATPSDGSPALEGHGSMRVVRGGSWQDHASMLRSSARMRATDTTRAAVIGFRVVRVLT